MLDRAADAAVRITNSDKDNLQAFHFVSGVLQIAAQDEFKQPFLDFFNLRGTVKTAS